MPAGPRGRLRALAAGGLLVAAVGTGLGLATDPSDVWHPASCLPGHTDLIQQRALTELHSFTSWLARNHARGYISEVGWPSDMYGSADAARWQCLADHYFAALDAVQLPATVWQASERPYFYSALVAFHPTVWGEVIDRAGRQAAVLAAHPGGPADQRGVNVAGAADAFGQVRTTNSLTNTHPGQAGREYAYPSAASLRYLAGQGVALIRLPVRWERLQPVLDRPLAAAELHRLLATVAAARALRLAVVVDVHNAAGYYTGRTDRPRRLALGTPGLPISAFADLWRRLALALRGDSGVSYGLMNEPADIPAEGGLSPAQVWEEASQAAVDAIRGTGDRHPVIVASYKWDQAGTFALEHPSAWIRDPLHLIVYEAHQYFDRNESSNYTYSYADETAALAGRPVPPRTRTEWRPPWALPPSVLVVPP